MSLFLLLLKASWALIAILSRKYFLICFVLVFPERLEQTSGVFQYWVQREPREKSEWCFRPLQLVSVDSLSWRVGGVLLLPSSVNWLLPNPSPHK